MGGQLDASVRLLPPGSFAFVMATGIVSTAFHIIKASTISQFLLVVAVVGLAILTVAYIWRLIAFRGDLARDVREPGRAFGFFTVVAGINVVGIRLYSSGASKITIALALIAIPIWLILTYALPGILILRPRNTPVSTEINGSWFLWVVATQSLAAVAAVIGHDRESELLSAVAVGMWGIGVMLYLMLATLVMLRLLTTSNEASTFSPSYWIYMGATAITVLAGARILGLPKDLPIMIKAATFVSGFTYIMWAFGTWWIPLLVIFGIWRHFSRGEPARYESGLWSIVFPIGMYSTASMLFGREMGMSFMVTVGHWGTWLSGAVWLTVTASMLLQAPHRYRLHSQQA
jgi:tellurite resistance protein TehA-like permease